MTDVLESEGDPHGPNTWENYKLVHDSWMEKHPFVLENHLEWRQIGDPSKTIKLTGHVVCQESVIITVDKVLSAYTLKNGRLMVQGEKYSYNAHFVNHGNILRYDNGHADPEEFHRHDFDLKTGSQIRSQNINRQDMPTLGEFFTEVAQVIGFQMEEF